LKGQLIAAIYRLTTANQGGSPMSEVLGLVDYLEEFIARRTVQGDRGVVLDLSPEEYKALADFLFQGMIVWMLGVERAHWNRQRRILVEVTTEDRSQPDPSEEEAIEKNDMNNVIIWRAL
jgi:hypothetical protein